MKPITKRQKLAAKRGRPRTPDVIREPNGRASRSDEPANLVALSARCRHLGFTLDQAMDQRAGSFLGYLVMIGRQDGISQEQYEAATRYQELRSDYLKANQIPDANRDNGVPGSAGDIISDSYVEWCKKAKEKYTAARSVIQDTQGENPGLNLWAVVDLILIREAWHHEMVGSFRVVCNALARHFRA